MATVDGITAKLNRAEHHLKVAKRLNRRFARQKCRVVPQFNPETNQHDFVAHLPEPPTELGLILGDAIHNIRTALDHTVWALVESNPNRPADAPGSFTMFPICDTARGYKVQLSKRRVDGVIPNAAAIIDKAQPYHRRDAGRDYRRHPLWVLNALENIDKHRRLTLTANIGVGRPGDVHYMLSDGRLRAVVLPPRGTFRDGAVVASFPGGPPDVKVSVQGQITIAVVFDEPAVFIGDFNALQVIETTLAYSRSLVGDLATFIV